MDDNELLLFDRINVIKDTITEHGEDNFYLSFSGGKDSTILHYLLDEALPGNKIPRVYINTGIEYNHIVDFVKELAKDDERIVIIKPQKNIKEVLETYGYPFKSKEHSLRVYYFNKLGLDSKFVKIYVDGKDNSGEYDKLRWKCPSKLLYQFKEQGKYNYSNQCCYKMKKEVIHKWQQENNKPINITGMRAEEGGNRARLGCIITNSKGNVEKFHPLIKVDEDFENWYVNKLEREREKKVLCDLYYPPFNFERTGCKGCPFALALAEQLEVMGRLLPNERKQCEIIWKPVYDEYRRLNYRLKKEEQIRLF